MTTFAKSQTPFGRPAFSWTLGHMLKKTTDTLTITSYDRNITTQTDLTNGLTRLDQQCNRTRTMTTNKKKKEKAPASHF
jgi:hypothetical protein